MSSEFDWLKKEIAEVRTNKFHLVDGPATAELRATVRTSKLYVPPSYRRFVVEFGNAKLYRNDFGWRVQVYSGPIEAISVNGEALTQFGRTENSLAYFKDKLLAEGAECPVFEWRFVGGLRKTADTFSSWLRISCERAHNKYKKRDWTDIKAGPRPFTGREWALVEARELVEWRMMGIADNGDAILKIHNGSDLVLPRLTIGIRGPLRPGRGQPGQTMQGIGRVPIHDIRPGMTAEVTYDCYKDFIDPAKVEVYRIPAPGPEDRQLYGELIEEG